jgi:hypothetical protein
MAVEYISENNDHFRGKDDEIKDSILDDMRKLATDRSLSWHSSIGCILVPDCVEEGLDQDENSCHIEIYVDPSLGYEPEDIDEDWKVDKVEIPATEYWKTEKDISNE